METMAIPKNLLKFASERQGSGIAMSQIPIAIDDRTAQTQKIAVKYGSVRTKRERC